MDEVKNKILDGAIKLYMKYGVKSLTMDDISRELGISKKTLYLYVVDKDDLVLQAMRMHLSGEEQECNAVFNQLNNPIVQMIDVIKWQFKTNGKLNQSALFDLKKYHVDSFTEFLAFKERSIKPRLIDNLKRGIETGLYHSDLNVESTVQIYLHLIDFSFSPNITGFNTMAKIMYELVKYHLYSVTSNKGRKILVKELEKFNIELQQFI
ncbi:MAG: TetR/AcrR family transcriptional regulator [Bacteroidetes bacterium]|nr:TetR/AcrR family transcriptional regulator [Bacteroidota bacterium]